MKYCLQVLWLTTAVAAGFSLPDASRQCIVGLTDDWQSSRVTLRVFEKRDHRWQQVGPSSPGRLGRNGSVWGRGLHPVKAGTTTKVEGDGKSPAGVFRIGGVWGYAATVRKHPRMFYRQITPRDLWVEDADSPQYNQHLILAHTPRTRWERKQQMRQGDPAHSLKLFIAHNAPPTVKPGAGSAIFFHIWRGGGSRPTAGCTSIDEKLLRRWIAWLDPDAQPLYILLPKAEYQRRQADWRLPQLSLSTPTSR
jgi:L,D-peptidoglycan transpeptidase YkuD (ErfK/YbiS/YcfS/YnhG family)